MNKYILLLFSIILIGTISAAVTCDKSLIEVEALETQTPSAQTIVCSTDHINDTSLHIISSSSFFTVNPTTINLAEGSKVFTISFNPVTGDKEGYIVFGDGEYLVQVKSKLKETVGCVLDIFPTVLTGIKVQQGEIKSRNIQLAVPSCYDSPVTVNGVALLTDEKPIQLGELNIGTIQPGNSIMIPIDLNAIGVSTGQYSDTLQLLLYDNQGNKINVPSVSVSVLVSQGIQPISNFTLSDLPTCSLDAVELNLNTTYKLTCSGNNPNVEIHPQIDDFYIKGISVNPSDTQYIYSYQPKNIGTTKIKAIFLYKNAPLGTPFEQEVRISPSGNSPISGTSLKVVAYQTGLRKELSNLASGQTTFLVLDNKTDSIVSTYKIYINGLETNNSLGLFDATTYDLRATSPGYVDYSQTFIPTKAEIKITVSPDKTFYLVGESINITTDINGTNLLINDAIITSPYTIQTSGELILKAVKEGYTTEVRNISVKRQVSYTSATPLIQDWKKGKEVKLGLTENVSWIVTLKEKTDDGYAAEIQISSGTGNLAEFKLEKEGVYSVKSDDFLIFTKTVESSYDWYNPFSWGWVKGLGYWWVLIIPGILFAGYMLFKDDDDDGLPMRSGGE